MKNILDRIRSIDAFRAVTMFLMIFVNDLDGVPHTPRWLKHAGENADALGLADTIFPAFLFIVGLAIPFAFENRLRRGDHKIPFRIFTRSFALIVIGFYHANMETYNEAIAVLPKPVWESLLTISFFFIFLDYSKVPKWRCYLYRGIGLVLLAWMSAIYKTTDPGQTWLHLTWWGILGLIGWAYLVCSLIYYYSNGVLWVQAAAWVFFLLFNLDFHFGMLDFLSGVQKYMWIAGNGAMQAFTMAGIVVSVMYMRLKQNNDVKLLWIGMILLAAILFNLGFIVRFFSGGISKAHDTPSWVFICTGISLVVYAFFAFLVDFKGKYNWVKSIEPAGTHTFTCYLVPYIFYPMYEMTNIGYPEYLSEGTGGLIKCFIFSFAMIWLTGLLGRIGVKLKI
ncbi:heparan-alpha-glucosaminide N-acetyltransferase domain-containing protein [Mucilaginibacter sp. RS28]|uniref:Heparan-alpha-glucosaminide N-acetyltransferase domain-containing protein n=1 Tax=Mucilaginibacter straminoryzae TaxID=2932774 RepID=A0A9X1WZ23_9SPHI|nr:heparan-alpha-glucosaminide N-acetyltransferase domain-containing protein [Mucilaginibacter straminoryzae]MCJ8208164.1 heparan-alpha-glucosaminide N-acetyltransferase domain-containing protein [Mucilaginibacter straminoryzae]